MSRKFLSPLLIVLSLSSCTSLIRSLIPPSDRGLEIIYGEKSTTPLAKVRLYKNLENSPTFSLSIFDRWVAFRKEQLEPDDEHSKYMADNFKLFQDTNWLVDSQKEKLIDAIVFNPSSYVLDRPEIYIMVEIIQVEQANIETLNKLIKQKYEFEKANKEILADSGVLNSKLTDYPGRSFQIITNHRNDPELIAVNLTRLIIPPQDPANGKNYIISLTFYNGDFTQDPDVEEMKKQTGYVNYNLSRMEFNGF